MEGLLAHWCAIPSHEGDSDGQRRMADALERELESFTASLERRAVGPEQLPALRVRSPEGRGRPVVLIGHYDTVVHDGPPGDPPVRREGDRLVARGAADMKGGLVVMIGAIRLLGAAGVAAPWEMVIVPDEEVGTPWSRGLIQEATRDARAGLVFEPALPDGRLVRARKGVGTLTFRLEGRAAHAGRDPHEGRSAISAAADLVHRLELGANAARGTTITITTIHGGSSANAVPSSAQVTADVRVTDTTEAKRVLAWAAAAARDVERNREVAIDVGGGVHRPPRPIGPPSLDLFDRYRTIAAEAGVQVDWCDVGGGSDANLLRSDLAVLDGLGVVGGQLHARDEYAELPSLSERAAITAALIGSITG